MADKKLTGIYFTIETLKRLKIYAASKLSKMSDIVEEAVKKFLDENEHKKAP